MTYIEQWLVYTMLFEFSNPAIDHTGFCVNSSVVMSRNSADTHTWLKLTRHLRNSRPGVKLEDMPEKFKERIEGYM